MAKKTWHIPIVKTEYLEYWNEVWVTNKPSKEAKRLHIKGDLGITKTVEASSKADAIASVEKNYPGYTIIKESIQGF